MWSSLFAAGENKDLSGTWVGKRYQYNADKRTYEQTFTYMFDLKQEKDQVNGTSYIKNEEGNYAEIKVRGLVVGDKFYFEEYEVIRAERPEGKIWCFKRGELNIGVKSNDIVLSGETQSFTEDYGDPCSGGVTYMTKLDEFGGATPTDEDLNKVATQQTNLNISSYPNPFVTSAEVSIRMEQSNSVQIDIIDIAGKVVSTLYEGKKEGGIHHFQVDASKIGAANRILIVRLKVGEKVFTRNLVQQTN